jgi:hypothetical protein
MRLAALGQVDKKHHAWRHDPIQIEAKVQGEDPAPSQQGEAG